MKISYSPPCCFNFSPLLIIDLITEESSKSNTPQNMQVTLQLYLNIVVVRDARGMTYGWATHGPFHETFKYTLSQSGVLD